MTAAGLATGNAVVLKPAEQSPGCALLLARALREAGVPPSAFALLPGEGEVGAALVRDPRRAHDRVHRLEPGRARDRPHGRRGPARPEAPQAGDRRDGRQELRDRRLRRRPRRGRARARRVGVRLRRPEVLGRRARALPRGDPRRAGRAARGRGRGAGGRPGRRPRDRRAAGDRAGRAQERVARYAAEAERARADRRPRPRRAGRRRLVRRPDARRRPAGRLAGAAEEIFGPLLAVERVRDVDEACDRVDALAVRAHRRPVRAQPATPSTASIDALAGRQPLRQPRDHRRDGRPASRSAATACRGRAPRPAGPATCCSSSSRAS